MKLISKAATRKMLLATLALVAAPAAAVQAVALATKPNPFSATSAALLTKLLTPLFVENNYA